MCAWWGKSSVTWIVTKPDMYPAYIFSNKQQCHRVFLPVLVPKVTDGYSAILEDRILPEQPSRSDRFLPIPDRPDIPNASESGLLSPLSKRQSSVVVRMILKHGLWVSVVTVFLGIGYKGYRAHQDAIHAQGQQRSVEQQTGACGSNINGSNNQTSLNCEDKTGRTK